MRPGGLRVLRLARGPSTLVSDHGRRGRRTGVLAGRPHPAPREGTSLLDVFARMLRDARFDTDDPMVGLEVELNLVDDAGDPAPEHRGARADRRPRLRDRARPVQPRDQRATGQAARGRADHVRETLRSSLNDAEQKSSEVGAHMVMIGILPTLAEGDLSLTASPPTRAKAAQRADHVRARAGHLHLDRFPRELVTTADSIVPEAACTSTQFHVQTSPDQFAAYWNASQAIAPGRVALAPPRPPAREGPLGRDPDPALRAGDRHPQRAARGGGRPAEARSRRALGRLAPRTVRGARARLPGPVPAPEAMTRPPRSRPGGYHLCPSCAATTARSAAGTVRSPTRGGVPHLRIEHRSSRRAHRRRPDRERRLLFRPGPRPRRERAAAVVADVVLGRRENFHVAAEHGIDSPGLLAGRRARSASPSWCCASCCRWPDEGLADLGRPRRGGRPAASRSSSGRCLAGVNGAEWFARRMHARSDLDRYDALRTTLEEYREHMHTNNPVHTWD